MKTSLLQHFEKAVEAPESVPAIRRLILDLAVRGKLAYQDATEGSATDLLKKIDVERARLKIKACTPDVPGPFEIPSNWAWAALRRVTTDRGQRTPEKRFLYIDVSSVDKEKGTVATPQIVDAESAPSRARKRVAQGDVIYSCVRPYLLNIAIIDKHFDPEPIASTAFAVLDGLGFINPKYLWMVLRSPFFIDQVERKMRGQAYPAINDRDLAALPIPIPPLEEQNRIAKNLDALLVLCDDLEVALQKRERRRDRLVAASLHALSDGDSAGPGTSPSFQDSARFYFNHLPRLTTRPEHVCQLRRSIIDIAVRGIIVRQIASEEHSADLLRGLRARQAAETRPRKYLPDIAQGDAPFAIPETWSWVPLQNLLNGDTQNGFSRRPDEDPSGIPLLRISAGTIRKDWVVAEEEHKLTSGIDEDLRARFELKKGDLLACRFNGNRESVGRLTIFKDYSGLRPIYPDKLIRVRLYGEFTIPALIRYFLNSSKMRVVIEQYCETTVGNWGISATDLKRIPVPVPPIEEQRRILARVDELLSLCSELQASVDDGIEGRQKLLESALNDALHHGQC